MQFGIHLVRSGVLSADEFVAVIERQISRTPMLGMLAIEVRKISMKQLFAILEAQMDTSAPFGEVAIALGFMSHADVLELIGLQSERCQSVAQCINEMGLVAPDVLNRELRRFQASCRGQAPGYEGGDEPGVVPSIPQGRLSAKGAEATSRSAKKSAAKRRRKAAVSSRKSS
jgi:hypothetical protein